MLFAEGVPAEVEIESDLIELPGLVTLGNIHWEADTPPGTKVEIRTPHGRPTPPAYPLLRQQWHRKNRSPAQESSSPSSKGPIDTSFALGPGWSAWSQQYQQPGDQVTSPSLRKFMQIQARLLSEERELSPALENISVELHTPVALGLRAEVWPPEAQVGVLDTFEIFVQPPILRASHLGPQHRVRRNAHQRRSGTRYAAY